MPSSHEFLPKTNNQIARIADRSYQYESALNRWKLIANGAAEITTVTPIEVAISDTVTVNGVGFTGATQVSMNGVSQSSFSVVSDTQITFTVDATVPATGSLASVTLSDGSILQHILLFSAGVGGTPVDPDAQAVITAVSNTGYSLTATENTAIQDRIADFKADGLWTDLVAYYGLVGNTPGSQSVNWKNPGTYDLVWFNETNFDRSAGIKAITKSNSTYGVASGLSPSIVSPQNDAATFYYVSEIGGFDGSASYMFGAETGSSRYQSFRIDSTVFSYVNSGGQSQQFATPAGYGSIVRTAASGTGSYVSYHEQFRTSFNVASSIPSARDFHILGRNDDNVNDQSSVDTLGAIGFMGRALTVAEDNANNNSEEVYQTALGRASTFVGGGA